MDTSVAGLTFPCAECGGSGAITMRPCMHAGSCPCPGYQVRCEECEGTGSVRCAYCGERAAVQEARGLGLLCEVCAIEEV
jgi:hypothetical protein